MRPRLIGAAVVIVVFVAQTYVQRHPARTITPGTADSFPLLASTVGPYQRTELDSYRVSKDMREVAAKYSWGSREVEVSLLLDQTVPHDALYCDLIRGENFIRRDVRVLKTAHSDSSFDVAVISKEDGLTLQASTNCWGRGCTAGPAGGRGWFPSGLSMASLFTVAERPLPLTIKLHGPPEATDRDKEIDALNSQLLGFLSHFDLQGAYQASLRTR